MLKSVRFRIVKNPRIWIFHALLILFLSGAFYAVIEGFKPRDIPRAIKKAFYVTPTKGPSSTPRPTFTPFPTRTPVPLVNENVVLVGAGDIVMCGYEGSEDTAELIERFPGAAIFAAGDISNTKGTPEEYRDCVSRTWGRFIDRIHPAPGNHDYQTSQAYGYFGYFGEAAGDPRTGYYSFNLGAWHIVMLNSECYEIGGCQPGSAEETWLRADLAAWPAKCTLAVIHRPLFVSGAKGNPQVRALWQALYDANAEIVISGHEHRYEHLIPVDPEGRSDPQRGIQEIMVGTGGVVLEDPKSGVLPISVSIISGEHGIIKLDLHPASYEWQFIPVEDGDEPDVVSDSGQGSCH
jgi:hypothetical protein